MKLFYILLFATLTLQLAAQQDTLIVNGKTYTGSITKMFQDHLTFKDSNGIDYLVLKEQITRFNIRSKAVINGVVGYEWVNNPAMLYKGSYPEFKDSKFYLRQAGAQAITAGTLLVVGSLLSGIGFPLGNVGVYTFGAVTAFAGAVCIIPTGVFLHKAGKVKSYRTL